MARWVEVDTLPQLRDPVLVVSLSGWVDAGTAGLGSLTVVRSQLEAAREFARVDLAELIDLQQTRPVVRLDGGVTREIVWPEITFSAGRLGRDVVLCAGPEPSLRWREVLGEIVELAERLGIERAFTVGGIPTMASHRRPVAVLATATSRDEISEEGAWRADYHGPTGAQSVLQALLGEKGIPTLALWAQVPHYLAGSPSPPAIRALLARLRELAGITVDLGDLDAEVRAYAARVEVGLSDRPDVAEVIEAIEEGTEEEERLPTGDEIASEIERFLRGQS